MRENIFLMRRQICLLTSEEIKMIISCQLHYMIKLLNGVWYIRKAITFCLDICTESNSCEIVQIERLMILPHISVAQLLPSL